jgi:hypothetical protein
VFFFHFTLYLFDVIDVTLVFLSKLKIKLIVIFLIKLNLLIFCLGTVTE